MQQYFLNSARNQIYPWVYGEGSFEANEIIPKVWVGSWSSALDKNMLKKKGITHILSAVHDIVPAYPDEFVYITIPLINNGPLSEIMYYSFNNAYAFIQSAINENKSVLIHCVYGVSRSVTLASGYLMRRYNMSLYEALVLIKSKRPQAQPIKEFITILNSYFDDCIRNTLIL